MNKTRFLLAALASLALFGCGTSTYAVVEQRPGSESGPLLFQINRLEWDGNDLEVQLAVHNNTPRLIMADRRFMILEDGPRKVAPRSVISRYRIAPYTARVITLYYPEVGTDKTAFAIDFLPGAFQFESGDQQSIEIGPLRFRIRTDRD